MEESNTLTPQPKFTKGGKCILAHLIITIIGILILLITYLLHILLVNHTDTIGIFDTRRSVLPISDHRDQRNFPIGLIYYINATPTRNICNTILLRREWAVSPGHCVSMLSDQDLVYLLYAWRIKYPYNIEGILIKRNIVHPHFKRDTFANNVGLIQHTPVSEFQRYKIPKLKLENYYYDHIENKNMAIINWNDLMENQGIVKKTEVLYVQPMSTKNCSPYVASIMELRKYEFCIILKKKTSTVLGYGALAVEPNDLTIFGIYTWGESEQKFLPLVILNLSHYYEWIESITKNEQT